MPLRYSKCCCLLLTFFVRTSPIDVSGTNAVKSEKSVPRTAEMQGLWQLTSYDEGRGGIETEDPSLFKILNECIWVSGGSSYWIHGSGDRPFVHLREIKMREEKEEWIDFVSEDGSILKCLYRLKNSSLTIGHGHKGIKSDRPAQLSAIAEKSTVIAFKRIEPKARRVKTDQEQTLLSKIQGIWQSTCYEEEGHSDCGPMPHIVDGRRKCLIVSDKEYYSFTSSKSQLEMTRGSVEMSGKPDHGTIDLIDSGRTELKAIITTENGGMTFCWRPDGKWRPESFSANRGDGQAILRLRLVAAQTK